MKLVALFSPEHGIRGTAEAGVGVADGVDARTGVPVYSLYGAQGHSPTPEMLKDVDVLVYDLQEVGAGRLHILQLGREERVALLQRGEL